MNSMLLLISVFGAVTAFQIDLRLAGGQNAEPKEFPFIVSIQYKDLLLCSGVILSYYWILSSASYLRNYSLSDIYIRAGKQDSTLFLPGEQILRPAKFIPHEWFNPEFPRLNNIALVKVQRPIQFTKTVAAIFKTPTEGRHYYGDAITIGWGITTTDKTKFPNRLQKADVSILRQCADRIEQFDSNLRLLCADSADDRVSLCLGDTGAPLLVRDVSDGGFILVGIATIENELCGTTPSIFTEVYPYMQWIKGQIATNKEELLKIKL